MNMIINSRDHLFFLGLNLLLRTTVSVSNLQCLTAPLSNPYAREWQNNLAGNVVTVSWSIDRVCATIAQCLGVSNFNASNFNTFSSSVITMQQLPPVQIQPDELISFISGSYLGAQVALVYYAVNETGFNDCDSTSGTVLNVTDVAVLGVASGSLQMGNNYFIANSVPTSYYECSPYGLRLNVIVQPEQCIMDESGTEMCGGNGRCLVYPYQSFYTCQCCPGFISEFCEQVDGCYNVTCHNGGTCNQVQLDNNINGFNCTCLQGFTGLQCEASTGVFCGDNECMNSGTCYLNDSSPFFTCRCQLGYTGNLCETAIDDCSPDPCISGTCIDGLASYTCQCNQDYTGANCETYTGVCPVGRCLNSGSCIPVNTTNSLCLCQTGFTGDSCQTKLMTCDSSPCLNHTDCLDYGNSFVCICNPGFSGFQCEFEIDECSSNPCKNNGTCVEQSGAAWSCICPHGFVQPTCNMQGGADSNAHQAKILEDAEFGLEIAVIILGILFFIAAIILLIYCCKLHKIYKHLCCRKKYVHVIDETYGPPDDISDVTTGAHPLSVLVR